MASRLLRQYWGKHEEFNGLRETVEQRLNSFPEKTFPLCLAMLKRGATFFTARVQEVAPLLANAGSGAWGDLGTYAGDVGVQLMFAKSEDVEELAKPAVIEEILKVASGEVCKQQYARWKIVTSRMCFEECFKTIKQIQSQRVGG